MCFLTLWSANNLITPNKTKKIGPGLVFVLIHKHASCGMFTYELFLKVLVVEHLILYVKRIYGHGSDVCTLGVQRLYSHHAAHMPQDSGYKMPWPSSPGAASAKVWVRTETGTSALLSTAALNSRITLLWDLSSQNFGATWISA